MTGLVLESFDDPEQESDISSVGYQDGYEAGYAAAEESHAAKQQQALESISAILSDFSFGYAEAREHLLGKLHLVMQQLSKAALPEILQNTFGLHLCEVIEAEFQRLADEAVQIGVSLEAVAPVSDALSGLTKTFAILPDASLEEGQAILVAGDVEVMLDLPDLLGRLQQALDGIETDEKPKQYG